MVEVIYTDTFERAFKKVDQSIKNKVVKLLQKIIADPEIGKPLRFDLKGERTVYVKPYRIIYAFSQGTLHFLLLDHRKGVYER